jgi:hypothetical protein
MPDIDRSPVIIQAVLRLQRTLPFVVVLLAGCGTNIRNKEKVQEAILERLRTRSGLDLQALEMTTTSVSFNKNLAFATVAFHPKGDSNVNSGMVMNYTLEARDGKWVVVNAGGSQGHAMRGGGAEAEQLPPGHPPVDSTNPHATRTPEADSGRTQ